MHETYLLKALELAQSRRGFCHPNPAVGAVIVRDAQVLSQGLHWAAGKAHAEVVALNQMTHLSFEEHSQLTLYVTLEPCCHFGKTPPCTQKIIESGIRKVIYAYSDPNPLVAGKGPDELLKAGVHCEQIQLEAVNEFYESYEFWTRTGRPFVTAKLALSLDGCASLKSGDRLWLSGTEAQAFTHKQRLAADAILTTAATVVADNPQLNARFADSTISKPVYVIDRRAILPSHAKIFETAERVKVLKFDTLSQCLQEIGKDGIHDLWVEAGGSFVEALAQDGYLNRAYFYVCPKILGQEGRPAFSSRAHGVLSKATTRRWKALGDDGLLELRWG